MSIVVSIGTLVNRLSTSSDASIPSGLLVLRIEIISPVDRSE